jgi:tRNA_anti-like
MKKRKNLKRIFLLLGVVIAVAALYGYKEYNRKNKNLHDVEAAFTLKPDEIISQFSNDEKKANTAYTGKTILITGTVKTVDKDDKGFYTVVLGDAVSVSSVRCSIDSTESSGAAVLQPNSPVKIKGICTGYNADESGLGLGSDVILNRCVIEAGK